MGKKSAAGLLTSVDSIFTTQEERDNAQRSYVIDLPAAQISDFPDHPFKVRMDESMMELADSVKQHGILVPSLVRPMPDGSYQMVSGHRRKRAVELAELPTVPCIVRELTDDEAIIIMVDSNLQREQVLPSEKAFAYKMKLDAMKRQAGRPSKENGATVLPHFSGKKSRQILAEGTQATASITGAPATIYNGDSFTLTLSGGSGTGAVTWEIVSGLATVDATTGKVTVTGTGEIQIKAVKAADTDYTQTEATITLNAVARPSPPTGGGGGGTYTPTYPPTVERPSGGGGTPSTSPSNPKQCDTVTVTPKPDSGYEVDTITVIDRNGKPVEVTKKPDGTSMLLS